MIFDQKNREIMVDLAALMVKDEPIEVLEDLDRYFEFDPMLSDAIGPQDLFDALDSTDDSLCSINFSDVDTVAVESDASTYVLPTGRDPYLNQWEEDKFIGACTCNDKSLLKCKYHRTLNNNHVLDHFNYLTQQSDSISGDSFFSDDTCKPLVPCGDVGVGEYEDICMSNDDPEQIVNFLTSNLPTTVDNNYPPTPQPKKRAAPLASDILARLEMDHPYYAKSTNYQNLGIDTPSDSDSEIDVVTLPSAARGRLLPNNPSTEDTHDLQQTMERAISRPRRQVKQHQQQQQPTSYSRGSRSRAPKRSSKRSVASRKRKHAFDDDEEQEQSDKRQIHNDNERQRRIDLKNLFNDLRDAARLESNAAKVVILTSARGIIEKLGSDNARLDAERSKLHRKQRRLLEEFHQHRSEAPWLKKCMPDLSNILGGTKVLKK